MHIVNIYYLYATFPVKPRKKVGVFFREAYFSFSRSVLATMSIVNIF